MKKTILIIMLMVLAIPFNTDAQLKHSNSTFSGRVVASKQGNIDKRTQQSAILERIRQQLREQSGGIMHAPILKGAKTTTTMERLIGSASYDYYDSTYAPLGRTDSSYLKYSNGRGSFFDYSGMYYDNFWFNDGITIYGNSKDYGELAFGSQPQVLSDTCLTWSNYFPSYYYMYDSFDLNYAFYDTNCNVTEYAAPYSTDPGKTNSFNRSFDYYNAFGKLDYAYILSWDYGVWDTVEYRAYRYDSYHRIISDSTASYYGSGTWYPALKWVYSYNSYGKYDKPVLYMYNDTSSNWDSSQEYSYTYYTDTTIKSVMIRTAGFSTILMPLMVDSFGYTAGVSYTTYEKLNGYGVDTFGNSFIVSSDIYTKHISSGLPDTLYSSSYVYPPAYLTSKSKSVVSYDGYSLPTISITYMWDTTNNRYDTSKDYIDRYYYESFTPSPAFLSRSLSRNLNVQNTIVETAKAKIYPNPVSKQLYIDGAMPGTTIYIFNMVGAMVYKGTSQNELEAINVQNFSPGVYAVQLIDKDGNKENKMVVKE